MQLHQGPLGVRGPPVENHWSRRLKGNAELSVGVHVNCCLSLYDILLIGPWCGPAFITGTAVIGPSRAGMDEWKINVNQDFFLFIFFFALVTALVFFSLFFYI